ncbi:MAG: TlpA family protein disulfide reductase, partial [Candidatus Delongbacteria bacterium]|nr:TlpA family protein disulfide reductase [Candidatus Delongbacteria bacterium]
MKKTSLKLFVMMIILTLFSCGKSPKDYSMQAFEAGMQTEKESPEKAYEFFLDFYKNSDDIDVLRISTSNMLQIDREKTVSVLKERAEKNPEDKVSLYLYARMTDDKEEIITLSRKIIELDPEWEYGYRIMTVTYMQNLFFRENETADQLKELFADDEKHFEKFKDFKTSDGVNTLVYYKYLLYKNDPRVKDFALSGFENKEKWATEDVVAEAYTFAGDYDKAAEHFKNSLKNNYSDMSEKELLKNSALSVFFKLQQFEKFNEAHEFIITQSGELEEKDRFAYSGMLYAKQNEAKKALSNIKKAAAMGFDEYFAFDNDPVYDELKKDKEWPEIERVMKANYDANSGERKDAAIASKFSKPAPETTFTDTDMNEITLESMKGNIVILDFWATWCGPCRMAMPVLSEFAAKEIEGVKIFSVNVWEQDPEAAKEFFEKNEYKMTLVYGEKDSSDKFGFNG